MDDATLGPRMAQEIAEQPHTLARLLQRLLAAPAQAHGVAAEAKADADAAVQAASASAAKAAPPPPDAALAAALRGAPRVAFAACGSSRHAALLGRYALLHLAQLGADVDEAHELVALGPNVWRGVGLCVVLSQSGETQDTLEAARLAQAQGVPLLALTNVVPSTLADAARWAWPLRAGEEKAVPATKSFVAQAAACLALALVAGAQRGPALGPQARAMAEARTRLQAALQALPAQLAALLAALDGPQAEALARAAAQVDGARTTVVLGRGPATAVAHEGALKLREGAYVPAQSFSVGEFKHGPLAMLDPPRDVVVALLEEAAPGSGSGSVAERTASNLRRLAKLGVKLVIVAPEAHPARATLTAAAPGCVWLTTPTTEPLAWPILAAVVLQRLTLAVARRRGVDPDAPRFLVKSIDVH